MWSIKLVVVVLLSLNFVNEIFATFPILNSFPSNHIPVKDYKRKPTDPKTPSNPIVLVPGDGGSRLDANLTGKPYVVHYACSKTTKDYFDLWLNLETLIPVAIDCWADNMRLVFNETTKRSEHAPGVDIRIPGFGGTESVEWLDPSRASQVSSS
uniref:Uncharacterized protein n=1 Tax=Panagrolaimus sp. PS1159 TaxID=55785 RepID=A0AC35FU39_9BILA